MDKVFPFLFRYFSKQSVLHHVDKNKKTKKQRIFKQFKRHLFGSRFNLKNSRCVSLSQNTKMKSFLARCQSIRNGNVSEH